jgi:hypothetical protein
VTGNEVDLQSGSTLADSGGSGKFLANNGTITVTGTIPAGQTVTVRGEPYGYGGETYYSTSLSSANKELINDGTLVLNPTGSGEVSGGAVNVESGSIHNNGLILAETETPTRDTQLLDSLTNAPGGRFEVDGGILQQNNGALTTNEGLVTVAPSAVYQLQEGAAFVNHGTFSPEIAGPASFGAVQLTGPCCNGPGVFTAGGTLAPVLLGGFTPAAGQEFNAFELDGGKFEGTFAALANGFSADYAHEASEPAYVGVVYGASAAGGGGGSAGHTPATGTPLPQLVAVSGAQGKLTVKASCAAGGAACAAAELTATVTEHLEKGRLTAVSAAAGKHKSARHTKSVTIASGSLVLAAGQTKTVTLSLNASGRALLAKYRRLSSRVRLSVGVETISTRIVPLAKAPPSKQRKSKK